MSMPLDAADDGPEVGSAPIADTQARLAGIAERLKRGESVPPVTVRHFLRWFGAYRRGFYKVKAIREALGAAGLDTDPNFEATFIDSEIRFVSADSNGGADFARKPPGAKPFEGMDSTRVGDSPSAPGVLSGGVSDPTYRIGRFAAANNAPISVKPDSSLQEAVTLMLEHSFSQLPVMQNERIVKGVVTWETIGSRLALCREGNRVADFMERQHEVGADESFFAVIPAIVENQYVLVKAEDNRITGIVTTSDLSLEFRRLAEPFLLLGEIENHIRRLIDGKFTADEAKAARDPSDDSPVESVADLTFGSYVRLLGRPDNWAKLSLQIDRAVFVRELDQVRDIRNDVMHFDPDPVDNADLQTLQRMLRLLQTLQEIGAT